MRRILRDVKSEGRRAKSGRRSLLRAAFLGLSVLSSPFALRAGAQAPADTMAFYKALDLETSGKYREAAPLFRSALRTPAAINALLGLERVYAELGWSDSLLAPL